MDESGAAFGEPIFGDGDGQAGEGAAGGIGGVEGAGDAHDQSGGGFIFQRQVGNDRAHGGLVDQQSAKGHPAADMMHRLRERHAHDPQRVGDGAKPRMVHHFDDGADALAFFSDALRPGVVIFDFG